jgi:long-chain acyl-CoA synthetase
VGEIAAHAIGARSLGCYRDALEDEVAYLLAFAGASAVIAEDEEQVDKLLGISDRVPSLRHIIYCDPRGMRKHEDPRLLPVTELVALGEAAHETAPGAWDAMVAATRGEDVAVLCTTSGTTARPKLAMLTGGAVVRHCAAYLKADAKGPEDEYVSVLPLPWIMEQIYALGWGLLARMKVNFVEEPETMMADFREIGPTFVLFAPRVWESLAAEVRAKVMDASPLKRRIYELGTRLGLEALDKGQRSTLADQLVFRALRDRLGFTRLTSAATGGAALGPDTFRFFQAMGVPLRQIYGQTETLGAYTVHRAGDVNQDSVGVAFTDEIETRIDNPDQNGLGEIVTRHPNMFSGYFGVAETGDLRDGWLHTGDTGYFDRAGHLIVIDRVKDMATTSRGDRFSPQYIENKLKFSPYVAEAVVLGDGRPHLAAMICIRFPIVSKWAERNRIAFTTYTDLSSRPEVTALLRAEVEKVNATLPEPQRIQDFLLLYKELDADDEELTRTRKVRRGVINEKYGTIIEAMYRGDAAIPVDTTIAFQDGTKQRIRTVLKVVSMRAAPALAQAAE